MAVQIKFESVVVKQRITDPIIQCIFENKVPKLEKFLKGREINALYSSAVWNDDVTPLSAAVACANQEIFTFLLKRGADPNIASTNGDTPLHYAGYFKTKLDIVRGLLAAQAHPDGLQPGRILIQRCSPLQAAAASDRGDIVKELIKSGAWVDRNYGLNPEYDKPLEKMMLQLASEEPLFLEDFKTIKMFFDFTCDVPVKSTNQVFKTYHEHFLVEDPVNHLTLFERYFGVVGTLSEQYRQSSIKWLKESGNVDVYIDGVIKRFPTVPVEFQTLALNSMNAVFCIMKEISLEVFHDILPLLVNCLKPESHRNGILVIPQASLTVIQILFVILRKSSRQKESWRKPVLQQLCKGIVHLTYSNIQTTIGIWTFGLVACVYECAPELITSFGLSSIPEKILDASEISMDETMKEKLRKLDGVLRNAPFSCSESSVHEEVRNMSLSKKRRRRRKKSGSNKEEVPRDNESMKMDDDGDLKLSKTSVQESYCAIASSVTPFPPNDIPRKWHKISVRWESKLERLAHLDASQVYRLGTLSLSFDADFQIAKGSDGTEVFLGIRDDGTEVAVKRMLRSNYQDLKNEEEFLRLPELDNHCIVRYVDFAEDAHFGYLVLQLCEYTLEEYIQNRLPEDTTQKIALLKKCAKEVLCSLKVLHSPDIKVLHRDIKPQNVLIDITGKARLADFGISRRLNHGQTTLRTSIVGTKCWKAREMVEEDVNSGYKRCSDIQVAGMLVYYILSGGHHPFGKGVRCESNILDGKYTLDHVEDEVAKDLIEGMINADPKQRPRVEETLAHPFFWNDEKRVDYLKKMGNEKEAENCRNVKEDLLHVLEEHTVGKSFSQWKDKLPPDLLQKLDGKKKAYPESTLGLLRFIRNLHEHYPEDAENVNLLALFPDLFGSVYMFAKMMAWNSRPNLKKFFKE